MIKFVPKNPEAIQSLIDESKLDSRRHKLHGRRYNKFVARGVPARKFHVLLEPTTKVVDDSILCGVELREGRYDSTPIPRLVTWKGYDPDLPEGEIQIESTDAKLSISVLIEGVSFFTVNLLRLQMNPEHDLQAIMLWQRARYYAFLSVREVKVLAVEWIESLEDKSDFAWLNRSASRVLYQYAREEGWRKLTWQQRQRYPELADAHWVREHVYRDALKRAAGKNHPVGEATLAAASGDIEHTKRCW